MKLLITESEMIDLLNSAFARTFNGVKRVAKISPTFQVDYPYQVIFEGDPSLIKPPEPMRHPEPLPAVAEKDDHF